MGFLEHIFAIRHKTQFSIAAEMEILSWIGQNFSPLIASTGSLPLGRGFFMMGRAYHSAIILYFLFVLNSKHQ